MNQDNNKLPIIGTILLSTMIIIFVFLWQKSENKKIFTNLEQKITDIEKKISANKPDIEIQNPKPTTVITNTQKYTITNPIQNPTSTPFPKNEISNLNTFSSALLKMSFKYPLNSIFLDRLNEEEKAVLIGYNNFYKPEIAPWYHSPIAISKYDSNKVSIESSALSNIKSSITTINNENAEIVEGNYPDYPAPGAKAENHLKIISFPSKNIMIIARDNYGGMKSNWNIVLSTLNKILETLQFQ